MKRSQPIIFRRLFTILASSLIAMAITLLALAARQTDITGPAGSQLFGLQVVALTNGNIVVTDPFYNAPGPITHTGAVYLYNGATGALISRFTGSTADDRVGYVVALSNGNFVVLSPDWDNGVALDAGAVTWVNGTTGITGVVSITNSLVGSAAHDLVWNYVMALSNGNYVVRSPFWDNGPTVDAGAVTWADGTTGITGVVSISNSLVGRTTGDMAGFYGFEEQSMVELRNSNYVVINPYWDNGVVTDTGAVTWANGTTGITGAVSITNSLVGSTADDQVGGSGVAALSNGNYVVGSGSWDNGTIVSVGAATWGNGATGITGVVSITNSLVGSTADDWVGGITALSNGNYVVESPGWNNGAAMNAGAVTWGNGATGITGVVSITNSLVGGTTDDWVSSSGVAALSNGNYVVSSEEWDNGTTANVGAATWGNGATGITGVVSITNSLVGSTADDRIGEGITALSNGNYVVSSWESDNGAVTDAGSATWGNGTTGTAGVVSITNSLVGDTTGMGVGGVTALSNGNYVVVSGWGNGTAIAAGAVTWGNGTTGITGTVSIANSLVGSTTNDTVGYRIRALSNGNYVVVSPGWDNGAVLNVGAVTWGDGTTGITGTISATNSLVGSTPDDMLGYTPPSYGYPQVQNFMALSNGNYVIKCPSWDNGTVANAGAVTLGDGRGGTVGPITAYNSVRGSTASGGGDLSFDYDYIHDQLIVGRPGDNIVTLFRALSYRVYLPLVRK